MGFWAEVRNNYFEDSIDPLEGDVLARISIDGWKTQDENEYGHVIARVLLSKHGDVLVDYHDNVARRDEMAQKAIQEAIAELKEYFREVSSKQVSEHHYDQQDIALEVGMSGTINYEVNSISINDILHSLRDYKESHQDEDKFDQLLAFASELTGISEDSLLLDMYKGYDKNPHFERLVNSEFVYERNQAIVAGYGLDRLVHDPQNILRAHVAEKGYGLDLLANDPDSSVQNAVHSFLNDHGLSLEEWIQANPEKCVYPLMEKQMRDAGLRVNKITILSADEVKKYASVIPVWEKAFWIQPGSRSVYSDYHAFSAGPHLDLSPSSVPAAHAYEEVRPALRMTCYQKENFHQGDNLSLLGNTWTVLDVTEKEVLLLADKSFGSRSFGKTSPYYETSDIKKQLDGWLKWKLGKENSPPSLASKISFASRRTRPVQYSHKLPPKDHFTGR